VIQTGAGDVEPRSRLCQSFKLKTTKHQDGSVTTHKEVTMPSKMDAARQLGAMCGWDSAVKINLGDSPTSLIQKIRKRQ
jgi:hypothetical protein